jgi:hypothetical protein
MTGIYTELHWKHNRNINSSCNHINSKQREKVLNSQESKQNQQTVSCNTTTA